MRPLDWGDPSAMLAYVNKLKSKTVNTQGYTIETVFVQLLKFLICLSVSFKSRMHTQGKVLREGHCIWLISLSCITLGWSWIWSVTQKHKGFRAGLIFTEESYHLLLELFGVNHTRNVFEVVCSFKQKSKPEEIIGVEHCKSFLFI